MSKLKLLIVDDEINILNSLRRTLEESFIVDTALGATEAVKLFENSNVSFDVIVCDFMMPRMNGEDFYNFILKTNPKLTTKIIFMTGGKYTADIQKFFDNNSNICLPKPFNTEDLLKAIKKVTMNT